MVPLTTNYKKTNSDRPTIDDSIWTMQSS